MWIYPPVDNMLKDWNYTYFRCILKYVPILHIGTILNGAKIAYTDNTETNRSITTIVLVKLQCLETNERPSTFQMNLVSTNVDSKMTDDADIPWNVMFELLHDSNMQSAQQCEFIQGHCTD